MSRFQCPPITHLSDPGDLHLPLGRTSDLAHRGPCSPRLLPTHVRAWGSALGPAYTLPAQPEPQGLLQKGETCFQTSGPVAVAQHLQNSCGDHPSGQKTQTGAGASGRVTGRSGHSQPKANPS